MNGRTWGSAAAVWCVFLSLSVATAFAAEPRGYTARPCGFDMDRNGVIGEPADRLVGDGVTADPDGDGIDEDIYYVDSATGSDTTGNGSASKPYKTVQRALNAADGPGDGAEDIICISGVFREKLTIRRSGVAGYYMRDGFQFPANPTMIVGWDRDGDGQYPPYDQDDIAILDGNVGPSQLEIGIRTDGKLSYIEIAHLTIQNYGGLYQEAGALKLFHWGGGLQSHVYVHDVEMRNINRAIKDSSARIVCSFWGGPFTDVAIINNLVDEYSSYFCRGAPPAGAGRFRFQNLTLKMYGVRGGSFVTGWKLWGQHNGVEILDTIVDTNASAWNPMSGVSGIGVCQGAQDWTIRGNLFIDNGVTLQPFASGYYIGRRLNNILIDRNIFRRSYYGWDTGPPRAVYIQGATDANAEESVQNAAVTNNFMYTTAPGWAGGVLCTAGNKTGPQIGTITIAGNTICGPFTYVDIWGTKNNGAITIAPNTALAYKQQDYVIKNNIITNALSVNVNKNVEVTYAPTGFVAHGNVYDPDARFRWNETRHWVTISFSQWKAATGQDGDSKLGEPLLVDIPSGDLHLDPNDTVARGFGVDITDITPWDFDGDLRDADNPTAGADVEGAPPDSEPPTVTAWYSAVEHGHGVGEALLPVGPSGFSEPRSGGIRKLIVHFSEAMDPVSFTPGSVQIAGRDAANLPVALGGVVIEASLSGGDTVGEITFTPALPDYAKYAVRISGATDVAGNPVSGGNQVTITALCGDVSGDLRVNATDLSVARVSRTRLIDPGSAAEVRADVSADGRVNASDLSRIRARRPNDARSIIDPTL